MAINYIEKGFQLHEEIERQGYSLVFLDGVWVSSNDTAVQEIIDNFIPKSDPNWDNFNSLMLSHPRFIEVSALGFQINPVAVSSLPTALLQVTTHGLNSFTSIWNLICYLGQATQNDRNIWADLAIENNLPSDFIAVLRG
ncbi:hypothetical protein [Geminocystis sp. NIES-3709]|uniref:hypothetical protein n=1 Tax=Geminocystis sp. NIES-3709 TaxID=1617448 RepID=UPI0005FCBA7F|nr:hypothetical protein [Geminocystis sp. NIES-3709]BAQ65552.1 syc0785_c [Geminocystis sp. NIES-3709]